MREDRDSVALVVWWIGFKAMGFFGGGLGCQECFLQLLGVSAATDLLRVRVIGVGLL